MTAPSSSPLGIRDDAAAARELERRAEALRRRRRERVHEPEVPDVPYLTFVLSGRLQAVALDGILRVESLPAAAPLAGADLPLAGILDIEGEAVPVFEVADRDPATRAYALVVAPPQGGGAVGVAVPGPIRVETARLGASDVEVEGGTAVTTEAWDLVGPVLEAVLTGGTT